MNRFSLTTAALAGLVALSGCAGMGYYGDHYGGDYGDYRRAPEYNGRYGRTSGGEYHRRVERDANYYVDQLDRYLRISNREERAIRDLLIDRTYRLLDQTAYGRHRSVYPFPRSSGRARGWWANTDREIERILDRRYREPYRYYNQYGGARYTEYYRHRRYDARRGWYDTRRGYDRGYRDGRRHDAARDAERRRDARRDDRREDRRDRREDRVEDRRDRMEDRRDDRRDRVEDRRDRREDRREERADRRDDRRGDRADRRRTQARTEDRRRRQAQRDRNDRRTRADRDDRRSRNDRSDRRARTDRDDDRRDRSDRRVRRDRDDNDRARQRREARSEDRRRDRRRDNDD